MDFYDRVKLLVRVKKLTIEGVADTAGISRAQYYGYKKHGNLPRADEAVAIANALETSVEYLVTGDDTNRKQNFPGLIIRDEHGREVPVDGKLVLIPELSQKVAAGPGQELLDEYETLGHLPFPTRMLRGLAPERARALEVRGDSMTGIYIFDGDMIVFVPGDIRGDGIYVLRIGDVLVVKRVEMDLISRKIRIISENPRYPDRIESTEGQAVQVMGKVYGWVHAHPY